MPASLLISFQLLNNLILSSIGMFYFKGEEIETEKFSKLEVFQSLNGRAALHLK